MVRPVRSLSLVYTGDMESSSNLAFVLTRPLDFKHQEDCSALRLDCRPPRHLRGVYSAEPPHPRLRRVGGCSVHQLLHPLPVGGYLVHQLLPSRQRRVVYSAEPPHPPLQRGGGCSVYQHLPLVPVEGSLDQLRLVSSSIARLFHFNPSAMPETNTHHGIPPHLRMLLKSQHHPETYSEQVCLSHSFNTFNTSDSYSHSQCLLFALSLPSTHHACINLGTTEKICIEEWRTPALKHLKGTILQLLHGIPTRLFLGL